MYNVGRLKSVARCRASNHGRNRMNAREMLPHFLADESWRVALARSVILSTGIVIADERSGRWIYLTRPQVREV